MTVENALRVIVNADIAEARYIPNISLNEVRSCWDRHREKGKANQCGPDKWHNELDMILRRPAIQK